MDSVATQLEHSLTILTPASLVDAIRELSLRHRTLTVYAMLMLIAAFVAAVLWQFDNRTVRDVNVWVKPLKFMVSTAAFALTTAWFMGLLPEHARDSRLTSFNVWMLILTSLFEVAYITWQGARGEGSHYNTEDAFHAMMYGLMGLAALMLTATQAVLAWQILTTRERPMDTASLGVVIGLVLTFVLGTISGFLLGGRQPPTGTGVPFLGWHLSGGDGRPAHFMGIHAHQVIPIAGVMIHRINPTGTFAVVLFSAGYVVGWCVMLTRALR